MFHNLITRLVEFANRRPSRRYNFTKRDRTIIEEEKNLLFSLSLSFSPSLPPSLFLDITRFFSSQHAIHDYLRDGSSLQTRTCVLGFSRSGKPRLIDSAVYLDCHILEDVVNHKYPPRALFPMEKLLLRLLFNPLSPLTHIHMQNKIYEMNVRVYCIRTHPSFKQESASLSDVKY